MQQIILSLFLPTPSLASSDHRPPSSSSSPTVGANPTQPPAPEPTLSPSFPHRFPIPGAAAILRRRPDFTVGTDLRSAAPTPSPLPATLRRRPPGPSRPPPPPPLPRLCRPPPQPLPDSQPAAARSPAATRRS
ncbi:vegetative cell wall protein gp1-like, partial [Capsicum annuum]|uniref:vegetative cell wall protein gp1-like n=1 Tax=Capsicum annuum TaxID=4072 RepID=UPI001FB04FB5